MRLSEKTLEINFCSQLSAGISQPYWWFGLTQAQEKEAGWDVATKFAGRWILFQLKASSWILTNGSRRFAGHHHQLVDLQARARRPLQVFYVFPTIGTTRELVLIQYILGPHLRFLDVSTIPSVGPPSTRTGTLRKSELHYFDLAYHHNSVTIHSDPVEVPVNTQQELLRSILDTQRVDDSAPLEPGTPTIDDVRAFLRRSKNRVAIFLPA